VVPQCTRAPGSRTNERQHQLICSGWEHGVTTTNHHGQGDTDPAVARVRHAHGTDGARLGAESPAQARRITELEAALQRQELEAQLVLRELRHFHYALDQHASVAITDVSGVISYANQGFCDLSGYSREELLGKTHAVLKSGAHSPAVYEELWSTILAGSIWHGELCNRKKNGEHYWVDTSIVPYKDDFGRIIQFVCIRIETTKRKLAEDRLAAQETKARESEERLRQISDSLPAMIAYWDKTGICRFANQAHFERFGFTPEQIVGMSFAQLFGATCNRDRRARFDAALKGKRQLFDQASLARDGTVRHWQSDYLPHWQDGQVIGFYALVIDITERKKTEERLSRQEALLATTSRMGEIGRWELRRGASGPQWSEMIYRIFDLPVGQAPTIEAALAFFPPDVRTMVVDSIDAAFEDGESFDFVAPLITAAGRHRWVRAIGEPQIVKGYVTSIVGALQDVTQQKQFEIELAQAQKLESIGQLSAGIAHEINTPSQFIGDNVGFLKEASAEIFGVLDRVAELARKGGAGTVSSCELRAALGAADLDYLREEVPRAIEQSADGIGRIQKIVGAMKEFSHPAMEKTPTDLNRAIESTIIVAGNEWKYVAEIKTDYDEGLPEVAVMPGSFNQVILNMIINAAHAVGAGVEGGSPPAGGEKGTIAISTRRVGNWAEVRIRDTGCGIAEDIRDRIFDPFFTTKPVGRGTGQGLAIAHDVIVKKHGGAIAVESEPGRGTTFVLRLPLSEENVDAFAAA
jgi:PAS domain S-box-containing protein